VSPYSNSSVCKLTSSGPNLLLSTRTPSLNSLGPLSWRLSTTPKYATNLTTGDRGAIHKLKPRLFNKSLSAPTFLSHRWSLLSIIAKYIPSNVVHYSGTECSFYLSSHISVPPGFHPCVTNFIWPYLHQFFDDSHGLKASVKPLRRPFDLYQSRLEAINIGRDIRQINW